MVLAETPVVRSDLGEIYGVSVLTRDAIRTKKTFRDYIANVEHELRKKFAECWSGLPEGNGSCDGCSASHGNEGNAAVDVKFQRDQSRQERYVAVHSFAYCKDTKRDVALISIDENPLYDQLVKEFTAPSPQGYYDYTVLRVVFYDELDDTPIEETYQVLESQL